MFNMPLEKFGYLTGRSLTTFKKRFQKGLRYHTSKMVNTRSGSNWRIINLAEKKMKNRLIHVMKLVLKTSHIFSFAFKKHFPRLPTYAVVKAYSISGSFTLGRESAPEDFL